VLVIEKDFSNDRVLSISAQNTPKEYEIVYQIQWSLFKDKTQLIFNVKHLELQDYSFDQNQLLGKSKEAEFIMDSLATRISRAVLARLGNI
jgi:outer membrane lipopolysaccharide assembly protein LptE/RlpB